jgi:hypothetical protein
VALHEHFNYNDLYHVVQIAAMALYYAGAKRMTDLSPSSAAESRSPRATP